MTSRTAFARRFWCVLTGGHRYISHYRMRGWICARCLRNTTSGDQP